MVHKTFFGASQQNSVAAFSKTTPVDGSIQLVQCNPSLQMPPDPKLIWKDIIYSFYEAKIFTVATKLKKLTCTPFEVGARAWLLVEGIYNVFSNQFGIWRLWGLGLHCKEPSCVCFSVVSHILKTSPHLLLFGKMLQCCFAVTFQKCYVDYKISPTFLSAQLCEVKEWIHIFGWTVPLRLIAWLLCHVSSLGF